MSWLYMTFSSSRLGLAHRKSNRGMDSKGELARFVGSHHNRDSTLREALSRRPARPAA